MKKTAVIFALLGALLSSGTSAFAAHPFVTEDTGTQGRGRFELELGLEYVRDKEAGASARGWEFGPQLSYGAAESVDILLLLPYLMQRSSEPMTREARDSGIGDFSATVKWRFHERGPLSLALLPEVTFATGNEAKGLGSGRASAGVSLVSTMELDPWNFDLQFGYRNNRNRVEERRDLYQISSAVTYQVSPRWRVGTDIGVGTNPDPASNTPPAFLLGGVIYQLSDLVDLDFGVKAGLNRAADDYGVLAGVTLRW